LFPTPKVTIGIPFRNHATYLELAIKSVFSQTFTDWELILMDDGSSDNSLALARSITDPRVRVYSDGLTKRLNTRLNELVSLARAPYFFRMDADDIMHPERVERQYAKLIRYNDDTVIGTCAYSIDANSRIIGVRPTVTKVSGFGTASFIHPSVAAATDWFRRNPYSESFVFHRSQDAELWSRTRSSSTFLNLSEPLLYYREVGVFSYENYIGSQLGMIFLLHELYRPQKTRYVAVLLKLLAKIFIVSLLDLFGCADAITSHRHHHMTDEQRQYADDGLARALSCPLPVYPAVERCGQPR